MDLTVLVNSRKPKRGRDSAQRREPFTVDFHVGDAGVLEATGRRSHRERRLASHHLRQPKHRSRSAGSSVDRNSVQEAVATLYEARSHEAWPEGPSPETTLRHPDHGAFTGAATTKFRTSRQESPIQIAVVGLNQSCSRTPF